MQNEKMINRRKSPIRDLVEVVRSPKEHKESFFWLGIVGVMMVGQLVIVLFVR